VVMRYARTLLNLLAIIVLENSRCWQSPACGWLPTVGGDRRVWLSKWLYFYLYGWTGSCHVAA
jgi:hypothetical protein